MLGPNITQGLNLRGSWVSQFLNWAGVEGVDVIVFGELQLVKVKGLDGQVATFLIEGATYRLQESTYHEDDGLQEGPQHIVTGLDPDE